MDISYGEAKSFDVETYGNGKNIFKFVITPYKSILLYFKIEDNTVNIDGIFVGNNYKKIKNKFDIKNNEQIDFIVSPVEGDPIIEFYFNQDGILKEFIYKNIELH